MKEIFATKIEELRLLHQKYELYDCGMSEKHLGWHKFQDDDAEVIVYYRME